jgi:hypothetical protein
MSAGFQMNGEMTVVMYLRNNLIILLTSWTFLVASGCSYHGEICGDTAGIRVAEITKTATKDANAQLVKTLVTDFFTSVAHSDNTNSMSRAVSHEMLGDPVSVRSFPLGEKAEHIASVTIGVSKNLSGAVPLRLKVWVDGELRVDIDIKPSAFTHESAYDSARSRTELLYLRVPFAARVKSGYFVELISHGRAMATRDLSVQILNAEMRDRFASLDMWIFDPARVPLGVLSRNERVRLLTPLNPRKLDDTHDLQVSDSELSYKVFERREPRHIDKARRDSTHGTNWIAWMTDY